MIPGLQRGSTLLVAVVILLLASLMALMAMNVGVFEQRSSGNDMRAKIVHQAAEAGLAQGFEYLLGADRGTPANPTYNLLDDGALWESCSEGANAQVFPCSAAPASQRANMWRLRDGRTVGTYVAGAGNVLPGALTKFMLPNAPSLPASGAFTIDYGVAPVLCRLPANVTFPINQVTCSTSTDPADWDPVRRFVTFVSVAQIRGDSGRTTLTQTVARTSLLANPAGPPSLLASGSVVPPGNGEVVSMPDAAGPGLDISVWSRLNVEPASGSFATCSRQDFLSSGGQNLLDTGWQDYRTCDGCNCGMAKKSTVSEDWDILDADTNSGINKDVRPDEFPCDLFEFAFGVKAWQDLDGDHFCEARMAKVRFEAPNGTTYYLYPDEAFLYQYAKKIIPTAANAHLVRSDQLGSGNLGTADRGLVWCQVDCMPNNGSVGSVANPVAVVVDPGTNTPYHSTLYGLLFYRASGDAALNPLAGGNASMRFNAQSAVYGSVIIQGAVTSGSGGGLIFGDRDILNALARSGSMVRFDTLRGGWTDRYSY